MVSRMVHPITQPCCLFLTGLLACGSAAIYALTLLKAIWLNTTLLLIEKFAQNEEHSSKVVLNRRTQGSLQIITQPQALNAMLWEKLADATHRRIIREYEVKEGKWFWINDCYYDTLSTSHFHASRKMWNTAENSKESYKNDPRAGKQTPKRRLTQAERWPDLCL